MKRNNAGFTLIEVLISIVILGLVVVPVCSGLLVSVRVNDRAEQVLEAKLAVSSAVEELMAEGIDSPIDETTEKLHIKATIDDSGSFYNVTVQSRVVDSVVITTAVRAVETPEGGGTG